MKKLYLILLIFVSILFQYIYANSDFYGLGIVKDIDPANKLITIKYIKLPSKKESYPIVRVFNYNDNTKLYAYLDKNLYTQVNLRYFNIASPVFFYMKNNNIEELYLLNDLLAKPINFLSETIRENLLDIINKLKLFRIIRNENIKLAAFIEYIRYNLNSIKERNLYYMELIFNKELNNSIKCKVIPIIRKKEFDKSLRILSIRNSKNNKLTISQQDIATYFISKDDNKIYFNNPYDYNVLYFPELKNFKIKYQKLSNIKADENYNDIIKILQENNIKTNFIILTPFDILTKHSLKIDIKFKNGIIAILYLINKFKIFLIFTLIIIIIIAFLLLNKEKTIKKREEKLIKVIDEIKDTQAKLSVKKEVISDYVLSEKIGEGGMGVVYKAYKILKYDENSFPVEDKSQVFAVKILNKSVSEDPEFKARFEREVFISKELNHKNIVKIYDWGQENDKYYIVMEYLQGITLRDLLEEKKQLPIKQAIDIIKQVLQGLDYAHSNNIIHRDIKPDNIFLTKNGLVKIMDFGVAKVLTMKSVTMTGTTLGTPTYMPPEQLESKKADRRSDIYSTGIMFYEMLAGRPPFDEKDPLQLLLAHLQKEVPDIKQFRQDIPEKLVNIINKMLQKELPKRFQSMKEILQQLENIS